MIESNIPPLEWFKILFFFLNLFECNYISLNIDTYDFIIICFSFVVILYYYLLEIAFMDSIVFLSVGLNVPVIVSHTGYYLCYIMEMKKKLVKSNHDD